MKDLDAVKMDNKIKNCIQEIIKKAKSDKQVMAVFLFGSCAKKENHKNSDLDICLALQKERYSNKDISKKKLDYLKQYNADINIFQQMPLYIRVRVLKEGKVLYCMNEDLLYDLAFKTIQEYGDYEHIYREYLEEVSSGR